MPTPLELIWLPGKPSRRATPRFRILLPSPEGASPGPGIAEEFALSVCAGAQCRCTRVQVIHSPPVQGATAARSGQRVFPGNLWLDLETKKLEWPPEKAPSPAIDRLSGVFRDHFSDADRQQLREWFFAEKLDLIHATPSREIDITNLPDASSGQMIGFIDVFPCGLAFHFVFEGELWAVDDQHCVQPDCHCTQTILSFLKLAGRDGVKIDTLRNPPSARYDRATRDRIPESDWPASGPSLDDLWRAMEAANPVFPHLLELRSLKLQSLYTRQDVERTQAEFGRLQARARPKVGRNDPCPCGSGRKFKHCCLNKPDDGTGNP